MLPHPLRLIIITINLNPQHRLIELPPLVLAQPCQRTANQAEGFACARRGFEDAHFSVFNAVVDGLHEGLLD